MRIFCSIQQLLAAEQELPSPTKLVHTHGQQVLLGEALENCAIHSVLPEKVAYVAANWNGCDPSRDLLYAPILQSKGALASNSTNWE